MEKSLTLLINGSIHRGEKVHLQLIQSHHLQDQQTLLTEILHSEKLSNASPINPDQEMNAATVDQAESMLKNLTNQTIHSGSGGGHNWVIFVILDL